MIGCDTNPLAATRRSLRLRLKDETRDLHEALERDLDIASPALSLDRYKNILIRFFGFYRQWEERAHLAGNAEIRSFLLKRRKLPALRQDLAWFGIDEESLPACSLPSCLSCTAGLLGTLYVVEGSTLGGQIIYRHLQQTMGLTIETGARFFYGYGVNTGMMWREFLNLLETHSDAATGDATVAAARRTFETLRAWLVTGQ